MTSRPILSIVTITYRDPEGLALTISSLRQLLGAPCSWEHIVVDSSPELNTNTLSTWGLEGHLVHVIQPPNGIYSAMNEGIRRSAGEIIWFLNSGDLLKSTQSLLSAIGTMRISPNPLLLAGAELMKDGIRLYDQVPSSGSRPILGINRICHQAMLFRKDLFAKLGFFSENFRLASDYEFHLRARHADVHSTLLHEVIVRYDMDGQSSSFEEVFEEFRQIHRQLSAEGKLSHVLLHSLIREAEYHRITLFKRLSKTCVARPLQWLWRRYQRSRGWLRQL
jgi:glycosyltransferase involved in cell wall biosynthesis